MTGLGEMTMDEALQHYGVKGMKWGVRRAEKKAEKEWRKSSKSAETASAVFQDAAESYNKVIGNLKDDPAFRGKDLTRDRVAQAKYDRIAGDIFNSHLAKVSVDRTYNEKNQRAFVYQLDRRSGMMRAIEVKQARHAEEGYPDYRVILDANGFVVRVVLVDDTLTQSDIFDEDYLMHYGVKGMKWGVRKDDYPGASKRVNKEASSDAREFARAKLFYGEGAGNRRKLIKATVESKSKKDPTYKEAFDHHLKRQDLGEHASKAQKERRRKDVKAGVGKNARAINRAVNGPFAGPVAGAALLGLAGLAQRKGVDTVILNAANKKMDDIQRAKRQRADRDVVRDLFKNANR